MKPKRALIILAIPLLFGMVMRLCFDVTDWNSLLSVMSISFLFLVPFGIGALTIYLSSVELAKGWGYRICMPWVPIFALMAITLAFTLEGWACWLMAMPIFM